MHNGALVESDYAQSHFFDFVAGRWDHVIGNSFNLNSAVVKVPEPAPGTIPIGILISSRVDYNWFHWGIETVPRLLLVDDLPDNVPILVSDRVPPAGIALLKMVTNRDILRIDATRAQSVQTLYVPGQVIFHPDSQEFAEGDSSFIVDGEVLQEFRKKVLSRMHQSTRPLCRKILITRRTGARVPFALGIVESTYRMFGFEVLDMAKLKLEEQLEAVANANQIVLLGGAGMTNLLFCNPDAKVVCFYPRAVGNYKAQETLAKLAGATLITLKGFDISLLFRLPHAKQHVRYFISPIMVARSMLFFRRGH
jgi:capsular polysaccharide biosynthesis protein